MARKRQRNGVRVDILVGTFNGPGKGFQFYSGATRGSIRVGIECGLRSTFFLVGGSGIFRDVRPPRDGLPHEPGVFHND